jgi:hypothetical protein
MIGIDQRQPGYLVAETDNSVGRPIVKRLTVVTDLPSDSSGQTLRRAIPDNEVIVKSLRLQAKDVGELYRRCQFELAQSVIEPESEFAFDVMLPDHGLCQIGLIYRNSLLPELESADTGERNGELPYLIRAAALGKGFATFGQHVPNELVALADLAGGLVSICMLYKRNVLGLTHFVAHGLSPETPETISRLAVEFKTVLNFRLAELSSQGISLPLAALYLSGDGIDKAAREVFARYFPVGVRKPELNWSFLADGAELETEAPDDFFVALGLAVI